MAAQTQISMQDRHKSLIVLQKLIINKSVKVLIVNFKNSETKLLDSWPHLSRIKTNFPIMLRVYMRRSVSEAKWFPFARANTFYCVSILATKYGMAYVLVYPRTCIWHGCVVSWRTNSPRSYSDRFGRWLYLWSKQRWGKIDTWMVWSNNQIIPWLGDEIPELCATGLLSYTTLQHWQACPQGEYCSLGLGVLWHRFSFAGYCSCWIYWGLWQLKQYLGSYKLV